ncbi:hypothetical protein AB0J80_04760 [Actinoplanes sp. NPDC049548]|uniref:hypothetical protein n=1 Tax=Actinoplanes sp. NPDC049548 TaxID=3155152 RepID=UPI00341399FD
MSARDDDGDLSGAASAGWMLTAFLGMVGLSLPAPPHPFLQQPDPGPDARHRQGETPCPVPHTTPS